MLKCLLPPHHCACAAFKHSQRKKQGSGCLRCPSRRHEVMVSNLQGDAGAAPGKEAGQEAPHACSGLEVHGKVCAAALC